MKSILAIALASLCSPILFFDAAAQGYPNRPVRVVVPQPAGSTPDLSTRLITPGLSNLLGQQFIVDNRGGAGGLIGTDLASKAAADGYTLGVGTPGTLTIMQHVQKNVPYNTLKDFTPIGLISIGPQLFVSHPSVPAKNIRDLVALAKAEPGKLTFGSAGNGSTNHLALELFKSMAGVDIRHVPYKGGPQSTNDLLGGHVNLSILSPGPILSHIKAQRLRVLAVTTAKRSIYLPEIPSISESGVKGFDTAVWAGLLAPATTPKDIVSRLSEALGTVINSADVRTQFERQWVEPADSDPATFLALLRREIESNGKLAKASGIRVD